MDMEEGIVEFEETGGDTAEMQITTVSGGELESILVVMTSIFLLLATLMLALKLHTTYGIGKDPDDLKKQEQEIAKNPKHP